VNCDSFVWSVLVLELLLEILIRPPNYGEMVQSDKAFAPSTARHMNRYHLLGEAVALAMFFPQVLCWFREQECPDFPFFRATLAPLWAITSLSNAEAARGRIVLGLMFLRSFGLLRHWKQMWIHHTYDEKSEERCKLRVSGHSNRDFVS
jgi:hypothetical protein